MSPAAWKRPGWTAMAGSPGAAGASSASVFSLKRSSVSSLTPFSYQRCSYRFLSQIAKEFIAIRTARSGR